MRGKRGDRGLRRFGLRSCIAVDSEERSPPAVSFSSGTLTAGANGELPGWPAGAQQVARPGMGPRCPHPALA